MKIVEIRGYLIKATLAEAQGNASGFYSQRSSLLVELLDADGHSGWGEAWHAPECAAALIRSVLGSAVLGQSPGEYARLWDAMFVRLGYDQRGAGMTAVSAIDMAIWDLRARQLGLPLSTLIGGARRAHVFAYAAGPYFRPDGDPYRSFVNDVRRYVSAGFRAIKMKIGVDPISDVRAVQAVRDAVGPDIALMVDANQGYTVAGATALARGLEPLDIVWLEEPVGPFDWNGYRNIKARGRIPIAGGEALGGVGAFLDFLRWGEPDIVQPDLAVCGGFTAALHIAAIAEALGRPVVPHVWGSSINLYATLQWLSTLPDRRGSGSRMFPWLEFDQSPNPLREIVKPPALREGGTIPVPDGPGIGVEINRDQFCDHLLDAWTIDYA